jgi:hypothetical protein
MRVATGLVVALTVMLRVTLTVTLRVTLRVALTVTLSTTTRLILQSCNVHKGLVNTLEVCRTA